MQDWIDISADWLNKGNGLVMKLANAVLALVMCVGLAACGGHGSPDKGVVQTSPTTVQSGAVRAAVAQREVKIAGYRKDFSIARDEKTGLVTLTNKITNEVLAYQSPALIKFVDKHTSFDVAGSAGQVYRLYQAAFNRVPDLAGLGFWIKASGDGHGMSAIAGAFIASAEFQKMYGANVDNSAFVSLLYNNVLHRAGEKTGVDWWTAVLVNGAARPDVLNGFAESSENQDNINSAIQGGFDYFPLQPGGPLLPFSTSYENKNAIAPSTTALPSSFDPSMSHILAALDPSEYGFNERSLSFGDFNQDGTLAVFAAMTRFKNLYPNDNRQRWPDSPSRAYFMHRGADGNWVDDSARLIPDERDRVLCVTPTYSIVADFNSDGKPDVYVPCTDIDFPVAGVWLDESEQHLLLSQPDGTYKRTVLPIGKIYGHQASAADIDGDGHIDIVTVDPKTNKTPFVLWGRGDGSFRKDTGRMPQDMFDKAIFGVVLIPIDGKLRLVVSGNTPGAQVTPDPANYGTTMLSYRNGRFEYDIDLTPRLPLTSKGLKFGLALDHIYSNGYLYSPHVSGDYSEQGLTRTDPRTGATELIFSSTEVSYITALSQIFMGSDGNIRYFGIGCNQYDDTIKEKCAYRIKP